MKLIEFDNKKGQLLRGLINERVGNVGVVCLHGFERTTVEMKFKNIVDALPKTVSSFRFDFSGCGLSQGDFSDTTATKWIAETKLAIRAFKKQCPKLRNIVLIAHSFAACVAVRFVAQEPDLISKLVLLGPAFNQRQLLRYYFARELNRDKDIDWVNYKSYFTEPQFELAMKMKKKMLRAHYITDKYFKENKEKDYQDYLQNDFSAPILIVEGDRDVKVPPASNDRLPKKIKRILVKGADHDFEKPNIVNQYLKQITKFIGK